MSGRRLVRKTVRTLLKTIFWLSIFVTVGVISYKTTLAYYTSTGAYTSGANSKVGNIMKATTDTLAVNAIFAVDGEDGQVKHLLLEMFHSDTGDIAFVSIPVKSQYKMSKELYETISKENVNVPQIFIWENLPGYFSQTTAYQYGCLILEECLDINISFYTLMPESVFAEYFEKAEALGTIKGAKGYTLQKKLRERLAEGMTSIAMEAELATYYTKVQSNLSLSKRNVYLSAYQEANYQDIQVYVLKEDADTHELEDKDKKLLQNLLKEKD